MVEFVHLSTYVASAKGLLHDDGQRDVEEIALPGRGKRGGARLIYYYRERQERIYLILIYEKGAKEDLTDAERNEMRKLASLLEKEA